MSSTNLLYKAAPSLQLRRTQSHKVAMDARRRLAQRDPADLEKPVSPTAISCAEVYYDHDLTVEAENPTLIHRAGAKPVAIFGIVCFLTIIAILLR